MICTMRNLFVLVLVLGISGSIESEPRAMPVMLADASEAAIWVPRQQVRIADHYGDPDSFIKYIIRKPPVVA